MKRRILSAVLLLLLLCGCSSKKSGLTGMTSSLLVPKEPPMQTLQAAGQTQFLPSELPGSELTLTVTERQMSRRMPVWTGCSSSFGVAEGYVSVETSLDRPLTVGLSDLDPEEGCVRLRLYDGASGKVSDELQATLNNFTLYAGTDLDVTLRYGTQLYIYTFSLSWR